jgi:hypothetical protein
MPDKNKGQKIAERYSFRIDNARLHEYAQLSAAARLQWLEEANQFLNSVSDPAIKNCWKMQRKDGL